MGIVSCVQGSRILTLDSAGRPPGMALPAVPYAPDMTERPVLSSCRILTDRMRLLRTR
jgi:hypothetical protein